MRTSIKRYVVALLAFVALSCGTSDWQTIRSKPPTPDEQVDTAFQQTVVSLDVFDRLLGHGCSAMEAELILYDVREIVWTLARDIDILNDDARWPVRRQELIDRAVIVVMVPKRADGTPRVERAIAAVYAEYFIDEVAKRVRHQLRVE